MNLATFLGSAVAGADTAAWDNYLNSLRNKVNATWNNTRSAYLTLKSVRESLKLPFLAAPGEAESAGGLTEAQNQVFTDLEVVVAKLDEITDEALRGDRVTYFDDTTGQISIEQLPRDAMKPAIVSGFPVLIDIASGQQVPTSGTLGSPVVWLVAGGVAYTAIVGAALYFTTDAMMSSMADIAEQKTMRSLAIEQAKLVASGVATPEQAAALTGQIYKGAKQLTEAKAKREEAKGKATSDFADAIKTLGWVAVAVTAGVFLIKVVPLAMES